MDANSISAAAVVRVAEGLLRGARADGVHRFLSVPYAADPVGERRFRAPQPHPPWEGEREALTPGPSPPQPTPARRDIGGLDLSPLFPQAWDGRTDYLAANIWTPDPSAQGLPVMVFIYGGAFFIGGKDTPLYAGAAFARSGVVLVSINYRLGLEGFVPIPGGDSNLGLRDQIAALAWVKANATAFGGDPDNVTVFGESAGAMSIADLLASPLARGLFRRAIIQSGHGSMVRSIEVGERVTRRIAARLGVAATREGLASRTLEQGLKAAEAISAPTVRIDLGTKSGPDPAYGISKFLPVFGDEVLPVHPLEALRAGAGAEVEVLIGTNREEMNFYLVPTGVRRRMVGLLARFLLGRSIPRAGEALRAYGLGRGAKAGDAFSEAMHDLVFRWPARLYAEAHTGRTHVYEFDWRSPACKGQLGACHGLELPFVFDTLSAATGPDSLAGPAPPQALAERVHGLWVDFARDGSLPWAPYSAADRQVYSLDRGASAAEPPAPIAPFAL
ncbi:MAG TPA: carboxylesterase family protein [Caulobacteraceae bacterium]|jgi:para-nitrobenzyl esterase|nr:carboxylesterase family protein [Caulobacteraceae bacterium]